MNVISDCQFFFGLFVFWEVFASCSLTLFRLWVAGFANSLQYICMKLILVYIVYLLSSIATHLTVQ